jgi:hypothetical protein
MWQKGRPHCAVQQNQGLLRAPDTKAKLVNKKEFFAVATPQLSLPEAGDKPEMARPGP